MSNIFVSSTGSFVIGKHPSGTCAIIIFSYTEESSVVFGMFVTENRNYCFNIGPNNNFCFEDSIEEKDYNSFINLFEEFQNEETISLDYGAGWNEVAGSNPPLFYRHLPCKYKGHDVIVFSIVERENNIEKGGVIEIQYFLRKFDLRADSLVGVDLEEANQIRNFLPQSLNKTLWPEKFAKTKTFPPTFSRN